MRLFPTLLVSAFAAVAFAQAPQPNIVFILADDLDYGELGCYGQKLIRTPSIDLLAAEGMRFTQFYAGGAVCAPSRSVFMTGSIPATRRFAATQAGTRLRRLSGPTT